MKAYKGKFKKKDGSERTMVFTRIDDLPSKFVASKIAGAGSEQKYPDGMELVWDLEADNFKSRSNIAPMLHRSKLQGR